MDKLGKLHVYTGDGKGKTTAGMGLALRALGHGQKVLIAQFLKDGTSGELKALETFPGARVLRDQPMQGFVFRMTDSQKAKAREEQEKLLEDIKAKILAFEPQVTVLDEICVALSTGMVGQDAAFALMDVGLRFGDVVASGRGASQALMDRADYVTRLDSVKHPFDQGLPARQGIEW